MKSKFLFLLIILLSGLICSCQTVCVPKNLGPYGRTLEELLEQFKKNRDEVFSLPDVGYELKDFYAAYYMPDFDKISKYDVIIKETTVESPSVDYMYDMGLSLTKDEVSYDRFTNKYVDDYYLLGILGVTYKFNAYDSFGNEYLVSVGHVYDNCYTSINIDKNSFIHEREIYATANEQNILLNLEFLINYGESDEKFNKIEICDSYYYITEKNKKIWVSNTSVVIKPVYNATYISEEDVLDFKYKDLIYLFSNEYEKSSKYEPMELKLQDFYSEIILGFDKKVIYVEK